MKNKIIRLSLIAFALVFSSCSEEASSPLCIQGPCGTVDETKINLAINIEGLEEEITSISLTVANQDIQIDSSVLDIDGGIFYTCWKVIPSQSITVITFITDNVEYTLPVTSSLNSATIALKVSKSNTGFSANLSELSAVCNDTN